MLEIVNLKKTFDGGTEALRGYECMAAMGGDFNPAYLLIFGGLIAATILTGGPGGIAGSGIIGEGGLGQVIGSTLIL